MADDPRPSALPTSPPAAEPSPFVVAFGWGMLSLVLGGFLDAAREAEQLHSEVIEPIDAGMAVVRSVTFLSAILVGLLLVLQAAVNREAAARRTAGAVLLVGTVLYTGCLAIFVVTGMPLWLGVVGPWGKVLLFVLLGQSVATGWTALSWYRNPA